ncbi:MAG: hypothetical protein LBG83_02035 [Oscillospiraceae bacterium]|jgi:hypothetical protein|nr:hypothetical protein [Oscillospiraceae bacterium]
MKKNYGLRAAGALLVAVMLTVGGVSGTFAKFVSAATAAEQHVRVAAFKVSVNGTPITGGSAPHTFVLDLYDTLYEANVSTAETEVDTSLNNPKRIAPGTGGKFDITVENDSEVPIRYEFKIDSITNTSNIPVEISVDGGGWQDVAEGLGITGSVAASVHKQSSADMTFYWRWDFGTEDFGDKADVDDTDTLLGITPPDLTLKFTFSASQVD